MRPCEGYVGPELVPFQVCEPIAFGPDNEAAEFVCICPFGNLPRLFVPAADAYPYIAKALQHELRFISPLRCENLVVVRRHRMTWGTYRKFEAVAESEMFRRPAEGARDD